MNSARNTALRFLRVGLPFLIVATLLVCVLLEYQATKRELEESVQSHTDAFAVAAIHRDSLAAAKLMDSLKPKNTEGLRLILNETAAYRFGVMESGSRCFGPEGAIPLIRYGAKFGRLDYCIALPQLVKAAVRSSFFLVTITFVCLGALWAMVIPLFHYRRQLKDLLAILAKWSQAPNESVSDLIPSDLRKDEVIHNYVLLTETIATQRAELQKEVIALQTKKEIADLAVGVAHDIRGPLTALEMLAPSLFQGKGEARHELFRKSLDRIRAIANNLLDKHRAQNTKASIDLSVPVTTICEEKMLQYRNHSHLNWKISVPAGLTVSVDTSEFERVVSNLVDNAVQAIPPERPGTVEISATHETKSIRLTIKDSGIGIPVHLLSQIGLEGKSFKPNGNGLGVFHARRTIVSWGASFNLDSQEGVGTNVDVVFPIPLEDSSSLRLSHSSFGDVAQMSHEKWKKTEHSGKGPKKDSLTELPKSRL